MRGSVRSATKADEPAIKKLIRAVRIRPRALNWQHFVVAVDEAGEVIGCGQVRPRRDGSREAASLAVAEDWRNQGIANAIIEELLERNHRPIWGMCLSHLTGFYEEYGGVEVTQREEMPSYFRWCARLFGIYARIVPMEGHLAVMVLR